MMRKFALVASFCLACIAESAAALGLGEIELQSALNQPLSAEIPLFALKPGQRELITVAVASDAAFARAGIERRAILDDIRFKVLEGPTPDRAILQLTTAQPVREPFLTVLIEVTWSEGRLIREVTALLDPPGIESTQTARRSTPDYDRGLTTRSYPDTSGDFPDQPRVTSSSGRGEHSYGPVQSQETLWSIAYAQRPNDSVTMDQMMLAIYEANPDAFDDGLNSIRAGSMLRIPGIDTIRAVDADDARRQVRNQRGASRSAPRAARDESPAAPPVVAPPPAEVAPPAAKPEGELRLSTPEGSAPAAQPPAAVDPSASSGEATDVPAVAPPPIIVETPAAPSAAPIEIRDNSAKALELLAVHAREYSAQQATSAPLPETPGATPSVTPPPTTTAPVIPPAATEPPTEVVIAPTPTPDGGPFVDEATPAIPPAGTQTPPPIAVDPAAAPPPAPVEEAPPAAAEPATPPVEGVRDALPETGDGSLLSPLMLGLGVLALLLFGFAAVKLLQRRSKQKTVQLVPIVLGEPESAGLFEDSLDTPRPRSRVGDTLRAAEPGAARTIETTMQATMPPERTTQQFMAVSTPQPTAAPLMPVLGADASPGASDPYADALSEVDIHIAYGLYDEAARLLQEPLAKSPDRKDLHLKLLEVYFSANMASEFESQAKKLHDIVRNESDPDWQKACIMGRQLCPSSSLFGAASGNIAAIGTTTDMDFSTLLGDAQPATPPPAMPTTSAPLDFGLDLGLGAAAPTPTPAPPPPAPAAPPPVPIAESSNTLDFDLGDFQLDTPAPTASPAAPAPPAGTSEAELDIDLSDFDIGEPVAVAPPPAAPPKPAAAAATQSDDVSLDELLGSGAAEGDGQTDTRLDLARAYMDMGEPTMAQSLLQEVVAQGNASQKQEAQELLQRLGAS